MYSESVPCQFKNYTIGLSNSVFVGGFFFGGGGRASVQLPGGPRVTSIISVLL